jgi:multiple sugar transport system substrate-binding protein
MYQGGEPEQKAVSAAIDRAAAKLGVTITQLYTPHDAYTQKLSGYISSGQIPDLIEFDGPNLFAYVWSGKLAPVADNVSKSVISDMTASTIAATTYPIDNKMYAVSWQDSTVLLYANREYLAAIGARIPTSVDDPWTKDEFNQILAKLATLKQVRWPLDIMAAYGTRGEWGTYGFSPILQSFGADLISHKTWLAKGTLDSARAVEAMTMVQTWSKNGWLVPASAGDNQLFNKDRAAAMAWSGHWYWDAAHKALGDSLVALPLPNFGAGSVSPNGSWVLGISAACKNKKLAGQVIDAMLTDAQFLRDLRDMGVFPGLKSFVAISDTLKDPKAMAIASAQAKTAVPRPPHPAYPMITQSFANAFDDILGGADVAATLGRAAAAIDQDIADNKGYPPFGK